MGKSTMWFPNRSDTDRAVQAQKMRRWLENENLDLESRGIVTICVVKTNTLISFAVNAKLICAFVFAYAKCLFSHESAHLFIQFYTWQ